MSPEEMIQGYKAATLQSEKDKFANDLMVLIIKTPVSRKWNFPNIDNPDEIWVSVKGYEGFYEISNFGRLKRLETEAFYNKRNHAVSKQVKYKEKVCEYKQGLPRYARTTLLKNGKKERVNIHVLVAKHFLPAPIDGQTEVNHKDGVKRNNHYLNLEWSTRLENMRHAFRTGLVNKGLNSGQVILVFNSDKNIDELATEYGVSREVIRKIKIGHSWSKVTGKEYKKIAE